MIVPNWALDLVTKEDYKSCELFGSIPELPEFYLAGMEKITNGVVEVENQGVNIDTLMSCTRQSAGNAHKLQQSIEFQEFYRELNFKNKAFWLRALANNPTIKETGDYIVNGPKQLKDENRIAGYYQVNTIDEAKFALTKDHYICIGSLNGDWTKVRKEKIYWTRERQSWHAFLIIWYNRIGFFCLNSYWFENGVFHMEYKYFDTLFKGKFACIDKKDEDAIEALRDKKYIVEMYPTLTLWQKGLVKMWTTQKKTVQYIAKAIIHWKCLRK